MSLLDVFFPPKQQSINFLKKFEIPSIAVGEIIDYDKENTLRHYRQMMPFQNCQILNTGSQSIQVTLDYSDMRVIDCISGGTQSARNQPFYSFQIKNTGTAPTLSTDVKIWVETIR